MRQPCPALSSRQPQKSNMWLHSVQPALNNAAGEVFAMDVSANPVLATLPGDGISMNLGQLKPCGVLLPHVHPRCEAQL